MTLYVKPNGTEIELNDEKATIKFALSHGWKPDSDTDSEFSGMNSEELVAYAKDKFNVDVNESGKKRFKSILKEVKALSDGNS